MFSIGICSSEREGFLLQALESLLTQDFQGGFQVVVADDNSKSFSPQNTLSRVAGAFKDRGIALRLVTHNQQDPNGPAEEKAGEGAMRNSIIQHSNQNFIVWLDDDDKLLPHTLSTYAAAITQNPGTDVFYGNLIRTDENFNAQRQYRYRDVPRSLLPSSLLLGSIIPNGGSCIKRTVFEKIGLYDPSFKVATDYQFWARAALSPVTFKHVDSDIYLYRSHSENAALDKEDDRFFDTNGRVCELLLRSCAPNMLFPFFEWKTDKSLAECQVTLAILTLAKRNHREFLSDNCLNELNNNEALKAHLANPFLNEVLQNLSTATALSFDQTAQLLSKIVEAGQKTNLEQRANQ